MTRRWLLCSAWPMLLLISAAAITPTGARADEPVATAPIPPSLPAPPSPAAAPAVAAKSGPVLPAARPSRHATASATHKKPKTEAPKRALVERGKTKLAGKPPHFAKHETRQAIRRAYAPYAAAQPRRYARYWPPLPERAGPPFPPGWFEHGPPDFPYQGPRGPW